MKIERLREQTIEELIQNYPFLTTYFDSNKLNIEGFLHVTWKTYLEHFSEEELEEWAIDLERIEMDLLEYLEQMLSFLGIKEEQEVETLTILPGTDKYGQREQFAELTMKKSDIIAIVGPTGSGKSRLLADIEWTANKDTPTMRSILINGEIPDKKWRFSSSNKLVAQLSQNMNFVMDLTVREFLQLHAKSRLAENVDEMIEKIVSAANALAGETFQMDTAITALSGGQSRALMIADTAILSTSPIVLIDEIENAGIDRKKALQLLVGEEKIVLMATHDPSLALMADRRIVISGGGIAKIIDTLPEEKEVLRQIEEMDAIMLRLRSNLRAGEYVKKV